MVDLAAAQAGYLTIQFGDVEDVSKRLDRIAAVRGVFVGVSHYQNPSWPALPNAAGDAAALADAFRRRCGMTTAEVLLDRGATLPGIRQSLRQIAAACGPDDLVVFHFSGHGIGLTRRDHRELKGLLLLADAPPLANLWRGDFTHGVVNLDLLDQEFDAAGITAKHRLVVLDSCYGGLGAYARTMAQPEPGEDVARYRLLHRATYVVSAGGPEQTVFDGAPGGHGLLTEAMLTLLNGQTRDGVVAISGRDYLSMREAFPRIAASVTGHARDLMRTTDRAGAPADRAVETAAGLVQVPLEQLRGGEGHIYLPWLKVAPGSAAPSASDDGAVATTVASRAAAPDFAAWGELVAAARSKGWSGDAWRELAQLLRDGPADGAVDFRVAAEPLVRVRSDALRLSRGLPALTGSDADLASDETERERIRGAGWSRLAERGNVLTTADELRIIVYNLSSEPIYTYVVGIDGRGNVQMLSVAAAETARLAPRSGRELPAPRVIGAGTAAERLVRQGWRLDGADVGVAHVVCVFASARPWTRLVDVVARLEAHGDPAAPAVDGLLAALPRRLGALQGVELGLADDANSGWPQDIMPLVQRGSGAWIGVAYGWRIAPGRVIFSRSGDGSR